MVAADSRTHWHGQKHICISTPDSAVIPGVCLSYDCFIGTDGGGGAHVLLPSSTSLLILRERTITMRNDHKTSFLMSCIKPDSGKVTTKIWNRLRAQSRLAGPTAYGTGSSYELTTI